MNLLPRATPSTSQRPPNPRLLLRSISLREATRTRGHRRMSLTTTALKIRTRGRRRMSLRVSTPTLHLIDQSQETLGMVLKTSMKTSILVAIHRGRDHAMAMNAKRKTTLTVLPHRRQDGRLQLSLDQRPPDPEHPPRLKLRRLPQYLPSQ